MARLMSSTSTTAAAAALLLATVVCMAAAAPVVPSSGPIVVLNPNFETPNTFHFETFIESWTSTSQAGLYRVPVAAYRSGRLLVSERVATTSGRVAVSRDQWRKAVAIKGVEKGSSQGDGKVGRLALVHSNTFLPIHKMTTGVHVPLKHRVTITANGGRVPREPARNWHTYGCRRATNGHLSYCRRNADPLQLHTDCTDCWGNLVLFAVTFCCNATLSLQKIDSLR